VVNSSNYTNRVLMWGYVTLNPCAVRVVSPGLMIARVNSVLEPLWHLENLQ